MCQLSLNLPARPARRIGSPKWMGITFGAASLFAVGNLFQPAVVVGQSMAPTLESGKLIWVDRTHYARHRPQRGEIVVFRHDGETYVKRIYRGPGEKVCFLESGGDWIEPVREGREADARRKYQGRRVALRVREQIVPEDSVFVLGDNFNVSEDSRQLGPIPMSSIIGRARLAADATVPLQFEYVPRFRHARSKQAKPPLQARHAAPAERRSDEQS